MSSERTGPVGGEELIPLDKKRCSVEESEEEQTEEVSR